MSDITGRDMVDRLQVLVSGTQIKCNQILGIPKLRISKEKEQAEAAYKSLQNEIYNQKSKECVLIQQHRQIQANNFLVFYFFFFLH